MLTVTDSLLVVIDVQGRLASLVRNPEEVLSAIKAVIKGSQIFEIPILLSEQAPQKIGNTVPEIAQLLKQHKPIEKIAFSCLAEKKFVRALEDLKRKQVIIVGIETHVCVYQTVRDLIDGGYDVYVVADAVSARKEIDHQVALDRMQDMGAVLVTSEMAFCELLQKADGPRFKEVLKLMKQN